MNTKLFFKSIFSAGRRRDLSPFFKRVVTVLVLGLAALEIYGAPFGKIDFFLLRAMFVSFILALSFICYNYSSWDKSNKVSVADIVMAVLGFSVGVYIVINGDVIINRWTGVDPLTPADIFFTATLVLLVLEVTRRTVGPVLVLLIMVFVVYNFVGKYLSGGFGHRGMNLVGFLDRMVYTFDGIFGTPIGVTCTYVYMFVLFGQVFNLAGGGDFFFRLSSAIAGRMIGGPAKMAVIASGLYGSMSGSPTSDVVTTGSITIPLMKRLGYSPVFAGAVEAAASSGASILPPIMGTAAFLMVDVAGIPYIEIAMAAAIPALIYYAGIMIQVHYRAVKKDLRPISTDEKIEKPWAVIKENFIYFIPIAVLVGLISIRLNPTVVGLITICATIIISWFKPGYRMGPKKIYTAIHNTGVRILTVSNASAAAGLVIGGIMLTGLGGKFTSLVFQATGGNSFLCVLMVAAVCIVLGMGMPIPAAYVLTATLAVPALLELDFPLMASHLFIVYFSAISAITPPVAVAAYAGAGIAGGNPNSTGFQAIRLAMAAFIVPIVYMYRPGLILNGSILDIIWSVFITVVVVAAMASILEGYFWVRMKSNILKFCVISGCVAIVWPNLWGDILGLIILGLLFFRQIIKARKTRKDTEKNDISSLKKESVIF
ncbi:TRAP transporter fused permease subunit [Desulfobacula sp.]|uniref:TRAP transporter permease n=1 Tax=Desulfobacula sp. TaxID=2593537 RepID=UPI00262CC2EF|nr:TRAP transporter fused permease subunit [Desulfobacula sp.]